MERLTNMDILADNSIAQNYNVDGLPLYFAKEQLFSFPDNRTLSHWNEGLEILMVCKGMLSVSANGVQYLIKEGEFCIINPGCVHFLEESDGQECEYYCCVIDELLFSNAEGIVRKYIYPLFHSFHPDIDIISVDSPYNDPLRKLFLHINNLVNAQPAAYDLLLVSALHEFIALLSEAMHQTFFMAVGNNAKSDSAMRGMVAHIHTNYSKNISIEALCKAGGISRNECFRLFKKYTGDTPAGYVQKYRLIIAKSHLTNSDLPISQIATMCGFAHQSHLTSHFSRYYGLTPLQYRKQTLRLY